MTRLQDDKMYIIKVICLAMGLILAACSAPEVAGQRKLTSPIALAGGTYTRIAGGLTVATQFQDIGGQLAVCGVRAETPDLHPWVRGSAGRVLLPGSSIYLDGHRLITNLDFLAKVPPQADYTGQVGACALTDLPWQERYATKLPNVRIPEQVVYNDADDGGGGIVIWFQQTGPGA